jgi:PPP family 3-phenylpropionic acid transporter
MRAESHSDEKIPSSARQNGAHHVASPAAAEIAEVVASSASAPHQPSLPPEELPIPSGIYDRAELDRALWVARLYYLAFFAALGSIVPFFNVYLQARGMSAPQIGIIASVPPIVALAASPFWGALSDRWQAHRRVLALCAFAAGVVSLAFIAVSTFASILLFLCLLSFFRTPISAILDSTVLSIIALNPEVSYGRQRVFGSFGWIAASLSVGFLVGQVSIYSIFILHAVLLAVICALLSLRLPVQRVTTAINLRDGLRNLIRVPEYRSVLVLMVLFGAGLAAVSNFVSLNVLRLGGAAALIGYVNASAAMLEIPVMFMGHLWTRRFSRRAVIIVATLGIGATWATIAAITSPWWIILLQALFGIFFALLWPALVGYTYHSTPDGLHATGQTLAQAGQSGLGWALGSLMSGYLWAWNPPLLFITAGALTILGALLFAAGTRHSSAT